MITRKCSIERFLKLYPEACDEAQKWLNHGLKKGRFSTMGEAWDVCRRGDWMDWLIHEEHFGMDEHYANWSATFVAKACLAAHINTVGMSRRVRQPRIATELRKRFDFLTPRIEKLGGRP